MTEARFTPYDYAVVQAAKAAIQAVAPAELPLLEDMLDPPRRLFRRRRSDSVGFGVDNAVHWLAPSVIAISLWYGRIWFDEGKSVIEARTRDLLSKGFSKVLGVKKIEEQPQPPTNGALTPQKIIQDIQAARTLLVSLGYDDRRAELTARAVVTAIITAATQSANDD